MVHFDMPVGIFRAIRIGRYAFVGSGTILLPGAWLGDGVIVGAGTVVRGRVPDYAIIAGSPGRIVGDSREFSARQLRKAGRSTEAEEVERAIRSGPALNVAES